MGFKELTEPLLSNNAPPVRDEITRDSVQDRFQNNNSEIVQSNQTSQSGIGISMFIRVIVTYGLF